MMRPTLARWLMKLAARVDDRPNVRYEIEYHSLEPWQPLYIVSRTPRADIERRLRSP